VSKVKIGTFNAENLFIRYDFAKKVNVSKYHSRSTGFTNNRKLTYENSRVLGYLKTKNVARVIRFNNPHILALQEIEGLDALKQFNDIRRYLGKSYPYYVLIEGNDKRMIDVALLSKFPISKIKSHQYDKYTKNNFIFSRDCLEVDINIGNSTLTLFLNHFDKDDPSKRRKQAKRVVEIIDKRFGDELYAANVVVLGDFSDVPHSNSLKPLFQAIPFQAKFEDVITRLPIKERWTVELDGEPLRHDYILLSKSLAEKNSSQIPSIERRGLSKSVKSHKGVRFSGVEARHTPASSHAAVFMELDIDGGYVPPRPPPEDGFENGK
jgi:endonuclease/exonuclease/phosphatase family metal-dependent hydrolase